MKKQSLPEGADKKKCMQILKNQIAKMDIVVKAIDSVNVKKKD